MANILLGDDDVELTQLLQEYLHNHGIRCDCVHDGEAVIERLKVAMHDGTPYDLLVLDIMMPKTDGLSVLRQLPAISDIPVIMLTAKGEEIDRIIGLELGADDYITKPCNPRELLARINAVIKRSRITALGAASTEHMPLPESRLHLDQNQRICQIDGVELQVTGTEFDLLVALLKQKARWSAKRGCHKMSYSVNCSRLTAVLMCMYHACVKNFNLFMMSLLRRFVVKAISWYCNGGLIEKYFYI